MHVISCKHELRHRTLACRNKRTPIWNAGSYSLFLKSLDKPFESEFSIFRMESSPFFQQLYEDYTHRDLYERFLDGYRDEQIWSFFLEYSVLARLLVLQVEQWGDACLELLLRLQTDQEAIAEVFFEGRNLGPVTDIRTGCSDPHHHGRTVFVLTFDSGTGWSTNRGV